MDVRMDGRRLDVALCIVRGARPTTCKAVLTRGMEHGVAMYTTARVGLNRCSCSRTLGLRCSNLTASHQHPGPVASTRCKAVDAIYATGFSDEAFERAFNLVLLVSCVRQAACLNSRRRSGLYPMPEASLAHPRQPKRHESADKRIYRTAEFSNLWPV